MQPYNTTGKADWNERSPNKNTSDQMGIARKVFYEAFFWRAIPPLANQQINPMWGMAWEVQTVATLVHFYLNFLPRIFDTELKGAAERLRRVRHSRREEVSCPRGICSHLRREFGRRKTPPGELSHTWGGGRCPILKPPILAQSRILMTPKTCRNCN